MHSLDECFPFSKGPGDSLISSLKWISLCVRICLPPRATSVGRTVLRLSTQQREDLLCLVLVAPGLLRKRNLEQQRSKVPTTGAIQRLGGLLPAIPERPTFGRKPESTALWSFQTLQIPRRTDLWSTCRLLSTREVAVFMGEPSFSRGFWSIFLRKVEE